ncbi:hypothetical protein [Nocardia otitidiscaviarum]|uniref:hypothetical protein n=1 Tax=Nocardia otitidiscaviarum TaxID=1823 RepID=UPI002453D4B2|nr:hypothetical protein [Nocardia otitidiscaviarum]
MAKDRTLRMPKALLGRWRIIEMDNWDLDAIELVGPGYVEVRRDSTGRSRSSV